MLALRVRLPTPHTIIELCDLIRTDESAIKVSEGCIGDQASFIHYESIGGAFVYTNNKSTEHTVRRRGAWILETRYQYNHAHTRAIHNIPSNKRNILKKYPYDSEGGRPHTPTQLIRHEKAQNRASSIQNKPHPFGRVPIQPVLLMGIHPSSHRSDGNHAILET
jgi:hypothetical protein